MTTVKTEISLSIPQHIILSAVRKKGTYIYIYISNDIVSVADR